MCMPFFWAGRKSAPEMVVINPPMSDMCACACAGKDVDALLGSIWCVGATMTNRPKEFKRRLVLLV